MTKENLASVLASHLKWLQHEDGGSRADLTGANLRGANLMGAYLSRALLREADLTRANLTGANLTGANLTGANLTGVYLTGANLRGANLTGAYLWGADLRGANLTGANLRDADLTDANLRGADLTGANLTEAQGVPTEEEHDWLIFYEDTACPPNHFGGTEAHAKKVLEEAGQNWTCHLYKRVASAGTKPTSEDEVWDEVITRPCSRNKAAGRERP